MNNRKVSVKLVKGSSSTSITKSNSFQSVNDSNSTGINDIITPPYDIATLVSMDEASTILGQCIRAYQKNIVGFGTMLSYKVDDEETPEMKAEWDQVTEELKYFNFDKPFKEVWSEAIGHREQCGNGYIEVIRNGKGLPAGLQNVRPENIKLTKLGPAIDVSQIVNGKFIIRRRKFRKYVQEVGNSKIWFKEFGDPRIMDLRTGEFVLEGTSIPEDFVANELLHLKIGDKPYGIPRWIGHLIHLYGARKAEELNYQYFYQGRHIPLAVIVSNGRLTEESVSAIETYASSLEGTDNAHKFMLIEAEGFDEDELVVEEGNKKNVKVELKPLADILQKDALFLEYDEKSRQKIQSSFNLPDIYIGYSRDYNRATADAARELTEEQVFIPERDSLAFIINHKLLADWELKYVEVKFRSPEITNGNEMTQAIDVLVRGGALTPNNLIDIGSKLLNMELEYLNIPEADIPIEILKLQQNQFQPNNTTITKSETKLLNVLKDIRDLLEERS